MSIRKLQENYEYAWPLAIRFADRLSEQLLELLTSEGISLAVPIESRVKTWDSIQNKIGMRNLEINKVSELGDLVGLRLILLFVRDVNSVISLLNEKLEVISKEDTGERLGDSQFGYQSVHLQLKLPSSWLSIPTFKGLGEMTAEIQVRTASQHIWAAASHVLQYKQESAVPLPVRRSINRVAALLETVDLELERTLGERAAYVHEIQEKEKDTPQFLAQQLDYETLLAYTRWKYPILPASDDLNLRLLQDLDQGSYPTLAQIDKVVEQAESAVEAYRRENPEWFTFGTDYITKSLGFVDEAFLSKHGFAKRTRDAIAKYKHLVKSGP
jgi:ppGpp synthetase/RelA/SpoT-type nucleotidyltranferase